MIKFHNVCKQYKTRDKDSCVDALKGVSFLIDEGEFVFIIGPSGSGKSTILKCMYCEEKPTSGTISIDGFVISDMSRALVPVLRRQIGMVFQDFRLIESKTVAENISFAGEIIGLSRKSLYQKVQLVLNIVGLKDKADVYPNELSGGEQQRVAIARAMLNNPKLIIADEPTGNLDPEISENIMGLLLDINRSGTTVIVCTHDVSLVDKMKKRVIEVKDGYIVRDKENSAYSDEEERPEVESLPVDFGDNAQTEKPPVGDFYFGDSPVIVPSPVRPAPVVPMNPQYQAPTPPATVPDEDGYDDEEVAFDEEITDISSLMIEDDIDEPQKVPEEPEEEVSDNVPDDNAGQEVVPEEKVQEEKENTEDTSSPVIEQLKMTAPSHLDEKPSEEDTESDNKDDESWLDEVRLDDIDLDIQEDDE